MDAASRGLWVGAGVVLCAAFADLAVANGRFFAATAQEPGASHLLRVEDLPRPYATASVDNPPRVVARPDGAWPRVPEGFHVRLYADGLPAPRALRVAPNGDVFAAAGHAGRLILLRGLRPDGRAQVAQPFVQDLNLPFGMAFYPPGPDPQWLYVGNTDEVVRIPYRVGDLKARGKPEHVADLPGGGHLRGGGHWTRDLAFSLDGKTLFVSVGSLSNVDDVDDNPRERHRADILAMTPDGQEVRVYASGIRNAVGIAVSPRTGELWASVNERDELGDGLVPDYITHVVEGGFYGWPWFYLGARQDPRHAGKHPELARKVIVPDVLLAPHTASLQMVFYDGAQFPAAYRGHIFAAQHGSWNDSVRVGYEVVRVPVDDSGHARGDYEDFLTGFVTPRGEVWGRPVGVAVAADGALLVSDDAGRRVWRVEANPR